MSLLRFEDGQVVLGNYTLPGNFLSTEVGKGIRFDEQKNANSGSRKVPLGFEDAAVTISLELTTDDEGQSCYDKLAEINGIFSEVDKKASPKVFDIDNRHLAARGVRRVIFSHLNSTETNQSDIIQATLSFTEYYQAVTKLEKNVAQTGAGGSGAAQSKAGQPNANNSIMVDLR